MAAFCQIFRAAPCLPCVIGTGALAFTLVLASGDDTTSGAPPPYSAKIVIQQPQGPTGTSNALAAAVGLDASASRGKSHALQLDTRGGLVETQSEWGEQLRDSRYFERLRTERSPRWETMRPSRSGQSSGLVNPQINVLRSPRSALLPDVEFLPAPLVEPVPLAGDGATFRTMCVRFCDGYYWPISFATTVDRFAEDAAKCEQSCGGSGKARLFTYPNPGGEIGEMADLDGRPYTGLAHAFKFQVSYDASCKCRAHPWEEAALAKHRSYARTTGQNDAIQEAMNLERRNQGRNAVVSTRVRQVGQSRRQNRSNARATGNQNSDSGAGNSSQVTIRYGTGQAATVEVEGSRRLR